MPPFRTRDEPTKTVGDFRAESNLGRCKTLLADTGISLKDKQKIVLGMARTGTELGLLNGGRVGDVETIIGDTLVLTPLNIECSRSPTSVAAWKPQQRTGVYVGSLGKLCEISDGTDA